MIGVTNAVTKGIGGIKIVNITITNPPKKTSYIVGDTFDPTGATVIARYSNDSTKDISDLCSWSPLILSANTKTIVCSYLEYGEEISIEFPITVQRLKIDNIPVQNGTLTYNGNIQSPVWLNYDNTKITLSGTTSGIDAGTFNAIFTPKDKYEWSDGTTDAKTISWTIKKAIINTTPSPAGALTYNGSTQSPIWLDWDPTQLTVSNNSGINAGTYTAIFTPTKNYQWADNSIDGKSVNWIINAIIISSVPTQSNTLSYTGSAQSPTWNDFNPDQLTMEGPTSSVNAGNFTVTFTPKTNYKWADGTINSKQVTWTIAKLTGSITLSSSSVTITNNTTITYNKIGDGTVSIVSNNSSIASVSVSNTTITITGVGGGTAIITATLNEGTNYTGASATCSVKVQKDFKYTYTGSADFLNPGTSDWILRLKTDGVLTIQDLGDATSVGLQIFMCGGGGSGGTRESGSGNCGAGGNGAYHNTFNNVTSLIANQPYNCYIGAGAAGVYNGGSSQAGNTGGTTYIKEVSALKAAGGEGGAAKAYSAHGVNRTVACFDNVTRCTGGEGANQWDEVRVHGAANSGDGGTGGAGYLTGNGGSGVILIRRAQ